MQKEHFCSYLYSSGELQNFWVTGESHIRTGQNIFDGSDWKSQTKTKKDKSGRATDISGPSLYAPPCNLKNDQNFRLRNFFLRCLTVILFRVVTLLKIVPSISRSSSRSSWRIARIEWRRFRAAATHRRGTRRCAIRPKSSIGRSTWMSPAIRVTSRGDREISFF